MAGAFEQKEEAGVAATGWVKGEVKWRQMKEVTGRVRFVGIREEFWAEEWYDMIPV